MLQGKFSEMHEYYMSILKIRLGEGIYEAVYKKVYTSDYYIQGAAKYSILTKFPDYLQMLLISKADLNQKNRLHINIDLMETLVLLQFLHETINMEYNIEAEESMLALQKDIFNGFENCIYYSY
jgi:hypothetical protein